jgi:hypothetical protein
VSTESSPHLRISDLDRESALLALGTHMSTGRIDLDEYGDRSAQITEAKTRGELAEVFTDLPRPHPRLDDKFAVAPQATPRRTAFWSDWEPARRIAVAGLTLTWFIAVALMLATSEFWWVTIGEPPFPLPAVFPGVSSP